MKRPPQPLNRSEIYALLATCRRERAAVRDRAFLTLAWRTGLRCKEILSLRIADIDFPRGEITVMHGKGDVRRVVGIDSTAQDALTHWLTQRERDCYLLPDSPVFCTWLGLPVASRTIRKMFARRGRVSGIGKRVHCHGMRHTLARELSDERRPLHQIAGVLGHSTVVTTSIYLRALAGPEVVDLMRKRL